MKTVDTTVDTAEPAVEEPERIRGVEDCLSDLYTLTGLLRGIAWANEGSDQDAALMFWGLHRLGEVIRDDLSRAVEQKQW